MSLVFCVIIYVLIVRTSISVGYYPISAGVLYGLTFAITQLIGANGPSHASLLGLAAAIECGVIIWILKKFDNIRLVWWPTFVVGVLIPIWAQVVT